MTTFDTKKENPNLLKVYIENQAEAIARHFPGPCRVKFAVQKQSGDFIVSLHFECSDYELFLTHQNWSPFKSVELLTVRLKDQLLQRFYEQYAYASAF